MGTFFCINQRSQLGTLVQQLLLVHQLQQLERHVCNYHKNAGQSRGQGEVGGTRKR